MYNKSVARASTFLEKLSCVHVHGLPGKLFHSRRHRFPSKYDNALLLLSSALLIFLVLAVISRDDGFDLLAAVQEPSDDSGEVHVELLVVLVVHYLLSQVVDEVVV